MTDNAADLTTLRAQLAQRDEKLAKAREALDLAVAMLSVHEMGDSRACSVEFVALAAVSCDVGNEVGTRIIREALSALTTPEQAAQ